MPPANRSASVDQQRRRHTERVERLRDALVGVEPDRVGHTELPRELEEAAIIDGASYWDTLFHVYLPLSVPALATLTLFAAVGHWNAWFDGMVLMTKNENYPIMTFLRTVVIDLNLGKGSAAPATIVDDVETASTRKSKMPGGRRAEHAGSRRG